MGLGHYYKQEGMEKGSRGSSEGQFCELEASALQKNVYEPIPQAITLNPHGIVTAVQPQQGMAKH